MPSYEEIIESFINGQYNQAYEQFRNLGSWELSGFATKLKIDGTLDKGTKIQYLTYIVDRLVQETNEISYTCNKCGCTEFLCGHNAR